MTGSIERRTVPEALERAAERRDGDFTFVTEDRTEQTWTFADLLQRSRQIGAALQEHGMKKGERVALILPGAAEFIPTFLGILEGGGVPVPLYPPMGLGQLGGYLDHAKHIVGAARVGLVVTTAQIKAVLGKLRESSPETRAMLTPADLEGDASQLHHPGLTVEDPCFIQFTSGSTSRPKGVLVTHDNLVHNCHAIMRDGLATDASDRGVSWLPLFHDMGLIGFVLAPIHHRVPVTFLPPTMFLKQPASWLQYLSAHRGTITYGPNFAYAIAAKRVRDRDLKGVDLSSVRVAGCGAEPIQASTLRAFAERFGPHGFREGAFVPSYGMAESTLAIAFSQGVTTDRVRAEALWGEGHAEPAQTDDEAVEIVECGSAFPGHEIRIVDPETRAPLGERRVGEIQVRGPSVMPGYFDNPEATARALDSEGWLSTGDLGYLAEGRLVICGRQKDVLIVNGRNYYPQDLEWAASSVEGIRAGNTVAFSTYRQGLGREAIVVLCETRQREGRDELARQVKHEIHRATGLMVDEVEVLDAGTIPKTSSGKVQRAKARSQFEEQGLQKREDEGAVRVAGRVMQSQLAHLRLRIFGP
jgi:acyl-CoA synthetase (AMP-forming)/AMP-acid ligase II